MKEKIKLEEDEINNLQIDYINDKETYENQLKDYNKIVRSLN